MCHGEQRNGDGYQGEMAWHGMAWRGAVVFVCDVTDSKKAGWILAGDGVAVCFLWCLRVRVSLLCAIFTFVIPVAFTMEVLDKQNLWGLGELVEGEY